MGLKNLIKGQLLSSISYRSSDPQELAAVYDRDGRRIMYESVLTVMPGQAAILVNEGQMTDIFMPGRYELTTNNMPVTTTLNQWKYGFHDTFIVDIIFVNTNEIIDIPWGTSEQVTVKDEVFGLVNVGANGKYSLSIKDPKLFAENLMGVKNRYTVADLKSFVTPQIAMYFKEIVTEKQMDFFDMQGYCYEAAQILKAKSDDFFGRYGIQMQKMAVQVALPETVKKSIDERASLGAFGGMDAYAYKRQVDAQADAIIREIKNMMRSFRIRAYDEDTGYGLLRHVLVRKGYHSGQIMVVLVLVSPILPSKNNFVKALRKKFPEISTVVINVNDRKTSMVLGERNITVYGKGFIEDELCGCTFRISPTSFYQVNPQQTEKLYRKAISCAKLTGKETVIDAYCGTGTIGLIASSRAKHVIGVELNRDAIKDAISNAKRNHIHNVTFYNEDAGQFMVEMAEKGEHADVVIMDPPRTGSDEAFLSSVVRLAPDKVVYVSCGPETLARDLKYLTKHGYRMKECTPFDLFPFTKHVETVVLLSQLRQKPDDYIDVDIDVAELEGTSAETKATYEKIKKYVAEHNDGMKVSNLYIAQVKRKCGIELAENFNLPKSEDARQPRCPKEKEEAIVEALKAFQMI